MNTDQQQAWINAVQDHVLDALGRAEALRDVLVFKGARVLRQRLQRSYRQSYDLDANITSAFLARYPDRDEQRRWLQWAITNALRAYFDAQSVVRYEVDRVSVELNPKRQHPLGWTGYLVKLSLLDRAHAGVIGLPALEIDIASPEELGASAIAPLGSGETWVMAYTLERIAGEKLRAFLSSLPTYSRKVQRAERAVRTKDVYDLAGIVREKPLADRKFWDAAGEEFRRACASRFVDCDGLASFEEGLAVTRASYETDASLHNASIRFDDAWYALRGIVQHLEQRGIVPFRYPLPT
jgi:predicted nucleotidyltransferase component of viral defense system